jgi:hypothetical protein
VRVGATRKRDARASRVVTGARGNDAVPVRGVWRAARRPVRGVLLANVDGTSLAGENGHVRVGATAAFCPSTARPEAPATAQQPACTMDLTAASTDAPTTVALHQSSRAGPPGRCRHPSVRARSLLAVLVFVSSPACAPMVMHSPRVERGPVAVFTGGVSLQPCTADGATENETCPRGLSPLTGFGVGYGWVPSDSTRPAYSLTGMLPLFDPAAPALDLYTELRAGRPARARGAGVVLSPRAVMPYAQIGRVPEGKKRGWYTTQGLVVSAYVPEARLADSPDPEKLSEGVYAVYWAPTITYLTRDRAGGVHLYASGALGRYHPRRYTRTETGDTYTVEPIRTLAALRLGATIEMRHLPRGPGGRRRPDPCPHGRFCPP